MSIWKWMMGVVMVVSFSLTVQAAEEFYLVKSKGLDKQVEMKVMSAAEYKELETTIKLQTKYVPAAITEAAKEWRADELNKGVPFPGNKVSAPLIISTAKFSSSEKATAELTKYEDMQAKKDEREAKKAKTKSKDQSAKEVKQESELRAAAELIKPKLEALIAKGGAAGAKGAGADLEAPGGAKVNAAVDKVGK